MKNVSNEFKNIIKAGGPFYAYASVVLSDGTSFTLDSNSDFFISGNSYSESGGDGFPLGTAVSKQITITLDNHDERYSSYDFYGAQITLHTEADLPSGSVERILEGTFTVIDSVAPGDSLEINAYDSMYKLDSDYVSKLTYPATLQQLWNELCSYYDLTNGSLSFANNDFTVTSAPTDITGRELAGYIAQMAIGNAIVDKNGRLCIKSYDFTLFDDMKIISGGVFGDNVSDSIAGGVFGDGLSSSVSGGTFESLSGYHLLSDFINDPDISTDDVKITGIQTTVRNEEDDEDTVLIYGTDEYALSISNPLITGKEQTAISMIGDALIGVTVRPFSGSFSPDPTIEFMDLVYVVDKKDNIYASFVTDNNFEYLGNSDISNGLEPPERNGSVYSGNASKIYRKVVKQLNNQKTQWEEAIDQLSQQVANSSGLYTTEEEQEDGSTIFYMHNKPTLEESDIVWKMTAETLSVSTDGGKNWNAGITVNGEMIAKIMSTIGINFDWGVGGTLIIQDKDGNQTAYIDANTGAINLSVQSLKIGGKTVAEIVSDEMGDYQPINLILSNEYQGIATDANGDYDIFPSVQTTAQAYYGQQNITDSCTFTTTASSGVTGSWNDSTHTYTVTGLTTDDGWVDITATYLNVLTTTKRFTMSKIKGGENSRSYYVQCDAQIIKVVTDDTLDPNCINLSAYYREGLASQPYAGRFKIEELQGDSWVTVYQSASDESTVKRYLYGAIRDAAGNVIVNASGNAIAVLRNIDEIRVTFYAAGGFDTVITVLSIPVVDTVASLSQKDTFNLLTDNGAAKGIYMVGNELYINATYLVTGILTDLLGKNFWNLDTGEFSLSPTTTVGGETVQEIADGAAGNAVSNMSQADVFNKLTNNGALPGIFMRDGQLYINANYIGAGTLLADYIKGGTLTLGGSNNTNGILQILNASGQQIGKWDKDGINASNADISGKVSASEGQIGNWQISGGNLTNGLPYTGEQNSNATGMGDYGGGWAFWAGNGKFSVEQSGKLRASDAEISGTVNANDGVFNGTVNADSGVFNNITVQNSSVHSSYMDGTAGTISGGTYSSPYISGGTLGSPGGTYVGTCSRSTLSSCSIGGTALSSGNGYIQSDSVGVNIHSSGGVLLWRGSLNAGFTFAGWQVAGNMYCSGNLSCGGSKPRTMRTKNFGERQLDAMESAEPAFSDFGKAVLNENGEFYVFLDPILAECVSPDSIPLVFLTKYGQGDIWVDDERTTHEVAVICGTPGLKFSWETRYLQGNAYQDRLRIRDFDDPYITDEDYLGDTNNEIAQNTVDYESMADDYATVCNAEAESYAVAGYVYFTQYESQAENYAAIGAKYYEDFERSLLGI